MKKLISQLKITPVTITVMLGLMFFFVNAIRPTLAQVPSNGPPPLPFQTTDTDTNNLCEPYMADYSSKALADFRSFLDTTFQNKSSTSSLLPLAISKYGELRDNLYTAYGKYYPNYGSILLTTGIQPGKCQAIIDQTLSDARTLLKAHAMKTAGVKKSTALIEKYQQINAQLANLYQSFVTMKANLDSFAGKIPCYAKNGCVKG